MPPDRIRGVQCAWLHGTMQRVRGGAWHDGFGDFQQQRSLKRRALHLQVGVFIQDAGGRHAQLPVPGIDVAGGPNVGGRAAHQRVRVAAHAEGVARGYCEQQAQSWTTCPSCLHALKAGASMPPLQYIRQLYISTVPRALRTCISFHTRVCREKQKIKPDRGGGCAGCCCTAAGGCSDSRSSSGLRGGTGASPDAAGLCAASGSGACACGASPFACGMALPLLLQQQPRC